MICMRAATTGLDRLLRDGAARLRGRHLALLGNRAATDRLGRPILDALAADAGLRPRIVYAPEHGFALQAEAGEAVASSNSGPVPVVSLYGGRKQPAAEELAQVDLFVADLPDIGSRYYTYMATLKACLAACAACGVPVLVLDRPNPLGGVLLEGPVADVFGSDVCCAPIPIRHGMTLGEAALFFRDTCFAGAVMKLEVLAADGWRGGMRTEADGPPWTPPSPNMPTLETALAYVGCCLFEGLNLNEGRGTETPFLLCGAPWLRPEPVLARVSGAERAGLALAPARYMPKALPGKAAHPRYCGSVCEGISIRVSEPRAARPLTTALAIIGAIHALHPELEWLPVFDTLAGGPRLREHLQAGRPAADLVASFEAEQIRFDAARPRLYARDGRAGGRVSGS